MRWTRAMAIAIVLAPGIASAQSEIYAVSYIPKVRRERVAFVPRFGFVGNTKTPTVGIESHYGFTESIGFGLRAMRTTQGADSMWSATSEAQLVFMKGKMMLFDDLLVRFDGRLDLGVALVDARARSFLFPSVGGTFTIQLCRSFSIDASGGVFVVSQRAVLPRFDVGFGIVLP